MTDWKAYWTKSKNCRTKQLTKINILLVRTLQTRFLKLIYRTEMKMTLLQKFPMTSARNFASKG